MPDGRPAAPRAARRRGENVLFALRRLSLGLFLAALASAVLLLSDAHQRRPKAQPRPRVAVFQIASRPVLDDSVRGVVEGLAAAGYREGTTLEVKRYNAEGDLPTANAIAREIVGGGFDVAITASTPALQALANANRDGRVLHVFCTVTDPFEAKVGLVPGDPLDPATRLGPLISDVQRTRVEGYIAKGRQEGALIAAGGGRPAQFPRGHYVDPTLCVNVSSRMTIAMSSNA